MTRYVLFPDECADAQVAGGKAAALARLADVAGQFAVVPSWFVVSASAFDASLTDEQRRILNDCSDPTGIQEIAASVEVSSQVTQQVQEALAGLATSGSSFAVRSSAVDEDGARHSFAGQLESYLFVPSTDVSRRIADVWRSGFTPRVVKYRLENGLAAMPVAPAVLVQQMIDADAAGVAFGADPIGGSRSTIVVSSVFGLGTALVGGDADADTYRIKRSGDLIERTVARKKTRHVADPSSPTGIGEASVDATLVDQPAVDDNVLSRIAHLVIALGQAAGVPQDVEWAVRSGQLYLLQSRPITSLSQVADADGVRAIWDNSNIAESYSGVTTPLTFTFARLAYDGVYRQFCRIMKVPSRVIAENDSMFTQMLGLIRGRVYYNLLNWYRLLAMLPGFSVNQKFMEGMMGVREGLPPEIADGLRRRTRSQRYSDRIRLAYSVLGLAWNHLRLTPNMRAFYARLESALRPPQPPLADMRLDELTAEFRRLESQLLTRWDAPLVNDFLAMIFFGVFGKLCDKWCDGERHPNLQNDLIADEGGIISAEPAKRIAAMAALVVGDNAAVESLCSGALNDAQRAVRSQKDLAAQYDQYVDKFGDRCLEELKLESSTLLDDPTPLLRAIGHTARRQSEKVEPAELFKPREAAERVVASALAGHRLRRFIFGWALRNARHRVRDRENLRFERTRLFGRVRRIFVEVGRRIFAEGRLEHPRDVFYLTLEETLSFVEGTSVTEDIANLARLRRLEFETYRTGTPPADRFETCGAVYVGNAFKPVERTANIATPVGELRGTGCCPGVVRGPVRIIRDPRGAQLRSGEILVAERTDPGWIMLFPAATGILVERGSLLSHSAIVAREMSIPAIVSIPNITSTLSDGQWVEMDGSAGTIRRIDTPSENGV